MSFSLGEYQDIFLEEADEQLQELNQNLLELEKNPEDIDIINNIFRAAHSLKSSAAFVGLNDLSDLAHKMENLLQGIRDQTMQITPEIVDVIFKCFDEINGVIEAVASGEEPSQDLTWIINEIKAVSEKAQGEAPVSPGIERKKSASPAGTAVPKTSFESSDMSFIKQNIESGEQCFEVTVFIEPNAQMKWVKAQLVINNLEKISSIVKTIPSLEGLSDDEENSIFKVIFTTTRQMAEISRSCNIDQISRIKVREISLDRQGNKLLLKFSDVGEVGLQEEPEIAAPAEEPVEAIIEYQDTEEVDIEADVDEISIEDVKNQDQQEGDRRRSPVLKTVKVSIEKLDQLLNNVGELVIANSGFFRLYEEIRKIGGDKSITNEFKSRMEQMSRIAKDLQTGIMKTRMVPIGQVFTRFNRLVRDLAKEHDKKIELVIQGEDTELDKKVIDAIGEPLMHLIRNAIDHGIESPEQRKQLGKSEVAHVTLNAHQGGNQIFVEVSDDGRGLDVEQIKRKVIEKQMATVEALANMDSTDICNFIFAPGFSTAKKVTDISGRGVGMNVVKEIVNELNGNVSIETEVGMGTRFVLAFPLTLAIIPAIMTRVRKEMYAIPLSDVNETIKISQSDITTIEGHEVINLRGEILSLLRLSRFVGLKSGLKKDEKIPVVVVQYGNRKIGLMVDYLEGKLEIVIKSLEHNYKTVGGLAGASILGDGSICLILDVAAMINKTIADQDRLTRVDFDMDLLDEEADVEEVEDIEDFTAKTPDEAETGISETPYEKIIVEPVVKEEPVEKSKPLTSGEYRDLTEKQEGSVEIFDTAPEDVVEAPSRTEYTRSIMEDETTPVQKAVSEESAVKGDVEVEGQVQEVLDDFRKELKQNIQDTLTGGRPDEHMVSSLEISREALNEFQLIANVGAANAAESLSKILSKRIDLSIPEVNVWPTEKIPENIGHIDSAYIGVMLPITGEAKGTVLFILDENVGFELIDMLYGSSTQDTRMLDEDGESALMEVTNIIGSSVLNVFAEKTGLAIKPDVPVIVHDYMQSIMDSIIVKYNINNDYAIIMDTAFYFENDQVIGNLLLLPEADSMKDMVEKLRTANV